MVSQYLNDRVLGMEGICCGQSIAQSGGGGGGVMKLRLVGICRMVRYSQEDIKRIGLGVMEDV